MRVETLIVVLLSLIIGISLSLFLSNKENEQSNLSDELEKREKVKMPNMYIKYSGEYEKKDVTEYKNIIDENVINILRYEDDGNAGK